MRALALRLTPLAMAALTLASPVPGASLITNGGFEEGTGNDLPSWRRIPWGQGAQLDEGIKHSGSRSLRVSAHGGMRTKLVSFPGGRVRVVGWMKTDNVIRGPSRSWHKAALQLVSYNDARESVGHSDVALVGGTHGWTRHERTFLLSRDVAYVAVHCHIWGADTRGTVWFDDISLELLDDPAALHRRKTDLAKATVTVDFGKTAGEFRHLWIGSDVGHMDRVTSATQVNAMQHARRFGFRYIRMHNCVHNPRIYSEDARGNPAVSTVLSANEADTSGTQTPQNRPIEAFCGVSRSGAPTLPEQSQGAVEGRFCGAWVARWDSSEPMPAGLQIVVDAWTALPQKARYLILDMVTAAQEQ